jgi:uncharacterized protein (DUF433 family)
MTMMFEAQVVPLQVDNDGVIRIGRTRVTLSTIIHAFDYGHTPEEIVVDFPALQLADVYAVITYYLNNRTVVESYLAEQEQMATETRQTIEARSDSREFRQRLLARAERS